MNSENGGGAEESSKQRCLDESSGGFEKRYFKMVSKRTDGSSENDTDYSSNSFRSTSTPIRSAKKKIQKIKRMVADNQIKENSHRSEEVRLRIQAKIEEQKSAVRHKEHKQRHWEDKTRDSSPTMATMISLSEDIDELELEAQKLLEELENAKKENSKPKQQKQKQTTSLPAKEGFDQEFLESRIMELEVENKILTTRLESGQATVDSMRVDISSMATSNQDYKKALRDAKAVSRPLQLEQESLRSQLQNADEELQELQANASNKRTARKVEKDQKEVFEQAAREILDLQRNRRLKKQINPHKMQERQQQTPSSNPMQAKPVERTIKRQTSWWQLDTPEKAQKQNIEIKDFDAPARVLSEDTDMIESESSDIDSIQ